MREESHLDDMRAAIRGDFERLAKRRGAQELMQDPVEAEPDLPATVEPEGHEALGVRPASDPVADPEPAAEPALEPEAERTAEPEPEPEPVAEPALEQERRRAPAPPPAPEPVFSVEVEADDAGAEPEIEEPPKRGLFARLLGL